MRIPLNLYAKTVDDKNVSVVFASPFRRPTDRPTNQPTRERSPLEADTRSIKKFPPFLELELSLEC